MSALKTNKKYSALRDILDFIILIGEILFVYLCCFISFFIPTSRMPLENEIVLITGAAHGIGKGLALRFAELKATVVLWDIDEENLLATESEIRAQNSKAHAFICDVSCETEVIRVSKLVQEQVGDVTILLNNAGILQNLPFLELDPARIKKTFEINILAHYWTIRCFLPKMFEMEKGHIAAISSAGGLIGSLYMADYGATKFAVVGLMEVLEEEIRALKREKQIHFTTVCPFDIDTGINQNPTCRLPRLFPMLDVKFAAAEIVTAIQKRERLLTLPRRGLYPILFSRVAPKRVSQLFMDYMNYNILPNDLETENKV